MRSCLHRYHLLVLASSLVLAPCTLRGIQEREPLPPDAREIIVERVGGAEGALPNSIRITLKNALNEAISFNEPSPLCPEAPDANHKPPLLGLLLLDEQGRESQFPPILTELSAAKLPPPRTVTLQPGAKWSKEYSLSAFHFWGPCGPAAPVPKLLQPGSSEVRVAAFLVFDDGSRSVSDSFAVKVEVPRTFFEVPSLAASVEQVDDYFLMMKDPPPFPGEPIALTVILEWLKEAEFDLRLHAGNEIRWRGARARDAVPALLELLKSADARDRLVALYALEAIGTAAKDALPGIQDLWNDSNPRVREKAEEAAAAIQGKPAPSRGEPTYAGKPVGYWIKEATREREPREKGRAEKGADADEEDGERQWKARRVLEGLGAKAVPYLIGALVTEDADVRWTLVDLLGELREGGEVDDLLAKALKNESLLVRRGVAEAIASRSSGSRSGRDGRELSSAAVLALTAALKDPDLEVQATAARGLGRSRLQAAVPKLLESLKSPSFELRRDAAQSLGRIGSSNPEVISGLKALVHDEDAYVRSAAAKALKALGVLDSGHVDFAQRVKDYAAERSAKKAINETTEAKLERLPVEADGVFFVVDRSGTSMDGFRFAKRYIEKVLKALGPDAEFGIVFVDRGALKFPGGMAPAKASAEDKAAALEFLRATDGGSGSCPIEGLHAALNFVEQSSARRKIILYIGDGGGTCSGAEEVEYLEITFEAISKRNERRAEIHALGVNAGPLGEGFLLYLSEKNGGAYTRLRVKEIDRRGKPR